MFIDLIAQHDGLAEEMAQDEQSSSQEPVAWEQFYPDIGKPQLGQEPMAIYRAGQAKGEGFHVEFLKEMGDDEVLLYTTPPKEQQSCDKRPWAGLTDEFCITNMFDMGHYSLQIVFKSRKNADEFKAALKEKNT